MLLYSTESIITNLKMQQLQDTENLRITSRTVGLLSQNTHSFFSRIPNELSKYILGFLPTSNVPQAYKHNIVDSEFQNGFHKKFN